MDRFTRYKTLRLLWARARTLLTWLHGPRQRDLHLRAQRWQQIQIAERHLADGMVRGSEDPDAATRPPETRWRDGYYAWQAGQRARQALWYDQAQRRNGGGR